MITESIMCLALNVYFEARSQSLTEQIAVAEVVMNRVESPRYPNSVCGVVKQGRHWDGYPIRHQCKFSWYCDGKADVPVDKKAWAVAKEIATGVYSGRTQRVTGGAIYYHAHYVQPYWAVSQTRIKRIGAHIFYR